MVVVPLVPPQMLFGPVMYVGIGGALLNTVICGPATLPQVFTDDTFTIPLTKVVGTLTVICDVPVPDVYVIPDGSIHA